MNDFEQYVEDQDLLEKSYFRIIGMKSRTGFYPTRDKWIEAVQQGRVTGSVFQRDLKSPWDFDLIQIHDPQYKNRIEYEFRS